MEMEFMAEFTEPMSRDQARQIIKRKRTKRQRPCSPFGMSTTSGYSTADRDCSINNSTPDQSPVRSINISTEEDEDMANCLIMLAQSVSPVKEAKSDQTRYKREKLSNPRLGFYVYECKTCNRSFPSFQALGGHRANHKKPKLSSVNISAEYPEEDHDQQKTVVENEEHKISVFINNNIQLGITNNKGKVHECSICGSEFSSGQALGGHMRKHRPIPAAVNLSEPVTEKSPGGSTSTLSLDLNFPPPDDVVQSKFQFTACSLVDCHY